MCHHRKEQTHGVQNVLTKSIFQLLVPLSNLCVQTTHLPSLSGRISSLADRLIDEESIHVTKRDVASSVRTAASSRIRRLVLTAALWLQSLWLATAPPSKQRAVRCLRLRRNSRLFSFELPGSGMLGAHGAPVTGGASMFFLQWPRSKNIWITLES